MYTVIPHSPRCVQVAALPSAMCPGGCSSREPSGTRVIRFNCAPAADMHSGELGSRVARGTRPGRAGTGRGDGVSSRGDRVMSWKPFPGRLPGCRRRRYLESTGTDCRPARSASAAVRAPRRSGQYSRAENRPTGAIHLGAGSTAAPGKGEPST